MTTNDPSTAPPTWTIQLCAEGTTMIPLTVSRGITVAELMEGIARAINATDRSDRLFLFCRDLFINMYAKSGNIVAITRRVAKTMALTKYPVLMEDGITVHVVGGPGIPQRIQDLWKGVADDLNTEQSIVWIEAVSSLLAAKASFEHSQAKEFINQYMHEIVQNLALQEPHEIEQHERLCVEKSFLLAFEIISMELQNQSFDTSISIGLDALGILFDLKMAYIKSSLLADSFSVLDGAAAFIQNDGLTSLAEYMASLIGMDGFPGPRVIAPTIEYLSNPGLKTESLQAKASIAVIVKASIDHLRFVISNSNTTYFPQSLKDALILKRLQKALLQAIQTEAIMTELDQSTFWELWASLILQMIHEDSPPCQRAVGWAAWHDLIEWSVGPLYQNVDLIVHGAGLDFVNGLYKPTTLQRTAMVYWKLAYKRTVPEGFGEMSGTELTCFRCTVSNKRKMWFISKLDEDEPGTELDDDYYKHNNGYSHIPRTDGWITCGGMGIEPPPSLDFSDTYSGALGLGQPAQGLPPFKFCAWVQEYGILEKAEVDSTYRECVSTFSWFKKGELLRHLQTLLIYGVSEEARSLGLPYDAQFESLITFDNTVEAFIEAITAFVAANSPENSARGLSTLGDTLGHLLSAKANRYRKIKTKNPLFHQWFGRLRGSDQLMKAVGFRLKRNSDGIKHYIFSGSVFSLPYLQNLCLNPPARIQEEQSSQEVASDNAEVEAQMVEEAIVRSIADID